MMRSLLASELLNIWEWGRNQPSWSKALRLLATACPQMPIEKLSQLSIGQRDGMLLTLREQTFGSQLVSMIACPSCGEKLEINFNTTDVRMATPQAESVEIFSLSIAGYEVSFRLPNSLDLIAIAEHKQTETAQEALRERCIFAANYNSKNLLLSELPTPVIDAVITQMAQIDPQANAELELCCPACSYQWRSLFDIVSFFWSEINAWAFRILREVHILASAYSWREADILAMTPKRRQLYLEMVVDK